MCVKCVTHVGVGRVATAQPPYFLARSVLRLVPSAYDSRSPHTSLFASPVTRFDGGAGNTEPTSTRVGPSIPDAPNVAATVLVVVRPLNPQSDMGRSLLSRNNSPCCLTCRNRIVASPVDPHGPHRVVMTTP